MTLTFDRLVVHLDGNGHRFRKPPHYWRVDFHNAQHDTLRERQQFRFIPSTPTPTRIGPGRGSRRPRTVCREPIEPFALLIGELAYGGAGGPELAYRFERLFHSGSKSTNCRG